MDDLIRRKDAIDQVCTMMKECFNTDEEELDAIAVTISELPSAQLDLSEYSDRLWREAYERGKKEIVYCKDCKYMTEHYDTDGNAPYWTCSEWDSGTDYDGFCHYAERRTE